MPQREISDHIAVLLRQRIDPDCNCGDTILCGGIERRWYVLAFSDVVKARLQMKGIVSGGQRGVDQTALRAVIDRGGCGLESDRREPVIASVTGHRFEDLPNM